jgi:putative flippase GtrA
MELALATDEKPASVRPGPLAAFVRFVVCGGGVGLLSSGALLLLSGRVSFAVANAVVTVVSTLLATELHGRFSFRGGRTGWSCHLKSALTVVVCYLFTTGAMLGLHRVHPAPGVLLEQAVYLAASGLAGIGRFVVLRAVIFAARGARPSIARGSVMAAA